VLFFIVIFIVLPLSGYLRDCYRHAQLLSIAIYSCWPSKV